MTLAAISLRVSTEDQAERGHGIEEQLGVCVRCATDRGVTIPEDLIFRDEGISGSVEGRPGLQAALQAARAGRFQTLIVYDWSRLARDEALFWYLIYQFREAGAEIISATDPGGHPMVQSVLASAAAEWRRQCREHTLRRQTRRISAGLPIGNRSGRGFEIQTDGSVTWDRVGLAPVLEAFRAFDPLGERAGYKALEDRLGVDRAIIRYWLRNPIYAGGYAAKRHVKVPSKKNPKRHWSKRTPDRQIIQWGHHEGVVPMDLWERVQARLEEAAGRHHSRHPGKDVVAVTGLLYCSVCDARLVYRYQRPLVSGSLVRAYDCPTCGYRYRLLDGSARVARILADWLKAPGRARALAQSIQETREERHQERELIEQEIRRLRRVERQLSDSLARDILPDPTPLLARLAQAQNQIQSAQQALDRTIPKAPRRRAPDGTQRIAERLSELSGLLEEVAGSPDVERAARPLVKLLVEKILLTPGSSEAHISLVESAIECRQAMGIQSSRCSPSIPARPWVISAVLSGLGQAPEGP